jgi:hypothetical protein
LPSWMPSTIALVKAPLPQSLLSADSCRPVEDWHDWDASNPPALIHTMGGKKLMAEAPKDGHLYGFDLADNKLLYRVPVTRVENCKNRIADSMLWTRPKVLYRHSDM